MKEKIIPITVLRNTQELEKMVKESNDPIVVTKNGYGAFAILSNELYQERIQKEIRDPAIYYSGNKTIFNEHKVKIFIPYLQISYKKKRCTHRSTPL